MKKLFTGGFDYIATRKFCVFLSLGLIVVGLVCNLIFGTSLDVTFKGGTLVKYSYTGELDLSEVASYVSSEFGYKGVDVKSSASGGLQMIDVYTTNNLTMDEQETFTAKLTERFAPNELHQDQVNSLSATMGSLFFVKCLVAIALASLFLILYVSIRFRKIGGWTAGLMAVAVLIHDMLMAYFAFVIFRIPLNGNFVAVLLAILGYSLNDTIVIYDRIRENRRLMDPKTPISTVVNTSLNQCFVRVFNTSLSTVLAMGSVAVISLVLGLDAITSFAVPMLVGLISGFYSSTFLCVPVWALWTEKRLAKKKALANTKKK